MEQQRATLGLVDRDDPPDDDLVIATRVNPFDGADQPRDGAVEGW